MKTKNFLKVLGVLIAVALLLAVLPQQAKAQEVPPQTLNVANWTISEATGVKGRETVLKDIDTYHMWYSSPDETTLYHTYSANPANFPAAQECIFSAKKPIELGSVSVVKEGDPFFMVAYGPDNKTSFAIYQATDKGITWKYLGSIFDVSSIGEFEKIDGPYLFVEDAEAFHYRLYFQAKIEGQYRIFAAESKGVKLENTPMFSLIGTIGEPVLSPGVSGTWDGGFVMQPWVVKAGKTYYMWYSAHNGTDPQRIGMAKSEDGLNWIKSPANPIITTTTGAEPSVLYDGTAWRMWYTTGYPDYINYYYQATGPFEFSTIQAAIDAASTGDTIFIHAGTYVENPVLNATLNPNKQLNFIGKVDDEGKPLPLIKGTLNIDLPFADNNWSIENIKFEVTSSNHTLNLKNVNGLTIRNCEFDGAELFASGKNGINIESGPNGNNLTVEDSVFKNGLYVGINGYVNSLAVINCSFDEVKSGVNIQGAGGNTVTVEDSNFSVIAQGATNDTYGVRFASSGANTGGNLTITNSSFVVNKNGFVAGSGTYHSAIIIRAGATGALKVENSSILGEVVNQATSNTLDASPNWWGSVAGAGASQIGGPVDFTPWCTDATCEHTAPDASGNVYLSGQVTAVPGGILINESNLIYHLAADTVIQNNSPCFVVNASNTQILAEPGAKCIPTGSSNGIDVADGLNNITIKGLEIDGSGQTSGTADGIHFAGAISDFVLADNKIHHMKGDGIEFAGEPTGVVDIAGNLFQNNTGLGINAGSFTVLAQYNSWGRYAGPVVSTDISSGVNATPFTHADVTLSPINEETTRVVTSLANVSGRPTVLKDGTLYHLWYGPTDDTLYHSISTNPAEFPVGETVTFSGTAPSEVSSTAIIKEGETFYMVAYDGTNNKAFALYSSTNGTTWTFVKQVFNATNPPMSDLGKIDAPFVFNDGGTYKLYFQKKSADGQRYDIYLATSTAVDGPYVLAQTDPVLSPNTDIAAWDGKFVMHPWVVKDADTGTYYMWYSAHNSVKPQQIGVATSTDGIDWKKSAANPVIGPVGEPVVIKDGDIWRMWYFSSPNIKYQTALDPLDLRQTLAYQVSANLVNVNAADVTITYPADLLTIAELTSGTDLPSTFDTSVPGQISFVGYKTGDALTKEDAVLFNVTFHTKAQGTGDITLSKAEFGMPGYLSSSNVYLAASADTAEVAIKELPFLATNLDSSYYLTGEARNFTVTITNYGTTYTGAVLNLTLPTGVTVTGVPPTINLAAGESRTLNLSFTSTTYGEKPIGFDLKDSEGALLFSTVETATVYDKPIITIVTDPYFIVDEPGQFTVTIENPATGRDYGNNIVFDVLIPDHLTTDFGTMSCSYGPATWTIELHQDGDDVKARILGLDTEGRFDVGAPFGPMTVTCTATLKTAGSYAPSWSMVDMTLTTERIVQTGTGSMVAYLKPVITPTNLGGPFDAGVPETVSLSIANTAIPEPFEIVFDYPAGTVIVYGSNTYTCDTACPAILVDLTTEPTVLSFTVTFDEAWTGNVSVSLYDSDWTPADRLLASASATGVIVNGNFLVTGSFSMQGNASRAGIPVTLTWGGTLVSYGPTGLTTSLISNNFSLSVLYGGTYTITTNQPRYLNVYADANFSKIITVDDDYQLDALQLRGGNAVWSNNVIDVNDASKVGADWGSKLNPDGNVNFDSIVNIQDLALVGGNYGLTSANAYADWTP